MHVHIFRKIKLALTWSLALILAVTNPMTGMAAAYLPEVNLLNDRSANIIGSLPLQLPGLAIPGGLTGDGVIVGLADSGLDKGSLSDLHPDLQSDSGHMPRIAMLRSYADRELPDDPLGHGTHMAATIVGSGKASQGQYKGIAPGASLYFQALLDKNGKVQIPSRIDSLFYPAYSAGVRIHVNGWGEESHQYNNYTKQIDDFTYSYPDFLPIFGAGNNGPQSVSLTSEANSKNALVVGSSQVPRPVFSSEAVNASQAADSSSRGPAQGGRIKPDLLAPGSAVISACSRLTESNYSANPDYTRMGGTSMAAAVSGGAAAILSEYLEKQKGLARPSSALLKALLINGAQTSENGPQPESGFGILDLANTILPLDEGSVKIAFNPGNLVDGQTLEYQFQVTDSERPFKATLAWIDSPSLDGSASPYLVDNLDLQVIDPSGKTLLGNDFQARGFSDQKNNVEQVVIKKPQPGKYIVRVHGTDLQEPVWASHFALVYGQLLRHEVVQEVKTNGHLLFSGGQTVNLSSYQIKGSLNGSQYYSSAGKIIIGSDVYLGAAKIFIFGSSWESGGIEILQEEQGDLLVEMNSRVRQGGYFIEHGLWPPFQNLFLNGKQVKSILDIPNGVQIQASINPQLQTVCTLDSNYRELAGVIEKVDPDQKLIKLIDDDNLYSLESWTAIASSDKLLYISEDDAPYGSLSEYGLENLFPSTRVSMMVAGNSNQVQHIKIERNVVVADLDGVNASEQKVKLKNGQEYKVFSGARIFKDGGESTLKDLTPGDKISGVVLGKEKSFIELSAFSQSLYGRVIYFNPGQGVLYLFDSGNRFKSLKFDKESQVYQNGLLLGSTAIGPGEWVRLSVKQDSDIIIRADLGEKKQEDEIKIFKSYDSEKRILAMSDGSSYVYCSSTQMTKGGYAIPPELLMPGEKIKITTLYSSLSEPGFLARAEVEVSPHAQAPTLNVSASELNGALIIRGSTGADRIAIIRQNGSREIFPVNSDGSFSRVLPLLDGEKNLRLLAVKVANGAVIGKDVEIAPFQPNATRTFLDIAGSSDRSAIERLAGKGILSGYSDGTYHPGQALNRAEFLSILGRAQSWDTEQKKNTNYFKDNSEIPWWALNSVYSARERGVVSGYTDGTFGAQRKLTRSEMVVILSNLLDENHSEETASLHYSDADQIPDWAQSSYINIYQKGWLDLFGGGSKIEPDKIITRAEGARILDGIFK